MQIGNKLFEPNQKIYIVGILNVTPDSFSDGGQYNSLQKALLQCKKMIEEGANIIDLGGESTRPGFVPVFAEEEIGRIAPVLKAISGSADIPISIDTRKPEVAQVALSLGASMVNNCSAIKDPAMAKVCAKFNAAYCITHNRESAVYKNFLEDCCDELLLEVEHAIKCGVDSQKIMLDPGIGFAKSYEQNIEVLRNLKKFISLGFPLMLGASRKRFLGKMIDAPVDQRALGTAVVTAISALQGVAFIRVHDVKENKQAVSIAKLLREN